MNRPALRLAKTQLSPADLDLIEELALAEARANYWAFRQWIDPTLLLSWFQREVARSIQKWINDYKLKKRPKLALLAPPQHGKTRQITELIAYLAGILPDKRSIYASFSDDLGTGVNLSLQRTMDDERYTKLWGQRIPITANRQDGKWLRNTSHLDYIWHKGSFINTTINGQITGKGLDFGFLDDPIKGRREARSLANRNNAWSWLTDDFFTRFTDDAAFLMIMTRWDVDDPMGRWLERFPETRVLTFKAIADEDEYNGHGELLRRAGEALFPEHKSLEFLEERKKLLTISSWLSLYQQTPVIVGGDLFPVEMFDLVDDFDKKQVKKTVRYWDKAGTEGGGAFTAGVLMHAMKDGTFTVDDVQAGQWGALERETRIHNTAKMDNMLWPGTETWVEQEPGSGGKESAEGTIRRLAGMKVYADRVTGAKEIRAEPYAAQVQAGNVSILLREWTRAFVDEHETFPGGKRKDQVDAAAGAFAKVTGAPASTYDTSLSWVG